MTPHRFLQYIPANNCGECGYSACLAFAVAVTKGGVRPELFPYLDRKSLPPELTEAGKNTGVDAFGHGRTEQDTALLAHLKSKVQSIDYSIVYQVLGADWSPDHPEEICFTYLDRTVHLGPEGIVLNGQDPADPRDQILLYNYVVFSSTGDRRMPDCTWVGMESLPNSISKVRTLSAYCELRLADRFSGRTDDLAALCGAVRAKPGSTDQSADIGMIVPVLPRIPLYLLFWDEASEEGFEARVKILFDQHVLDFLDLESLVFAAERMADRLTELDC